jgi:hypothetical protein
MRTLVPQWPSGYQAIGLQASERQPDPFLKPAATSVAGQGLAAESEVTVAVPVPDTSLFEGPGKLVVIGEERPFGDDFALKRTDDHAIRTRLWQNFAGQPVDVTEEAAELRSGTRQMLGQKSTRGGGEGEIGAPGGIGDDAVTLHLQEVAQAQHVRRQGQRLAATQRLEQIVVSIAVPGIAQAGKGPEKAEGHHLRPATGIEVDRPSREFAAQRRRQFASVAADAPEVVVGRVANDTHRIFRPACFTQNATDLQRTLACRLGIAGSDDHLSRPQAQCRQSVLHDLLGSQADKNAWLERHVVFPKASEAVIVHFLPALASRTRA